MYFNLNIELTKVLETDVFLNCPYQQGIGLSVAEHSFTSVTLGTSKCLGVGIS